MGTVVPSLFSVCACFFMFARALGLMNSFPFLRTERLTKVHTTVDSDGLL